MRALKERTGLTFRQLEERAAERGDVLARSTLADVLRHGALPRAEVVTAFVRACGLERHLVAWLEARDRIAGGTAPDRVTQQEAASDAKSEPAPPQPPDHRAVAEDNANASRATADPGAEALGSGKRMPWQSVLFSGRSRWSRRALAVAGVVAVTSGCLALAWKLGDSDEPTGPGPASAPVLSPRFPPGQGASSAERSSLPAPGTYRIRAAVSSLCLSERDGEDAGNVYQTDCRAGLLTYAVEQGQGGAQRIRSLHPVLGYGCLGVGHGSSRAGAQLMDDYCGHRGTAESFRIEPVTSPLRGYRITPLHTGACVSVLGDSRRDWTPVVQLPCRSTSVGQIFFFDPAPPPTAVPTITSN